MPDISRKSFIGMAAGMAIASISGLSLALASTPEEGLDFEVEEIELVNDGYAYPGLIRKPIVDAEKVPMVLVLHGFGGNMQNEVQIAICEALAAQGIASMQIDVTDMGGSERPFADHSLITNVSDARVAFEYIRGLDWVSKAGLIGHSQGGATTCVLSSELSEEGAAPDFAVVLAPANMMPDTARAGEWEGVTRWWDEGNPPEDPEELIDAVGNGALFVKYNYWKSIEDMDMWDICSKIACPVLLIWGENDPLVLSKYVFATWESIPTCDMHVLSGEDHSFANRTDDVIELIEDFVAKQTA